MSRYNTFKYSQKKYGATSVDTLLWALEIDWDGDGVFDGSNEAGLLTNVSVQRGRDFYLKSDGSGFEPVIVGQLSMILDNDDGRFDAFNTSSPIYPVVPGRLVRLRVKDGDDFYPVFAGRISDIRPLSSSSPKQVSITAVDGKRALQDVDVAIDIQETIGLDDAISMILDAAEWPTSWGTDIDVSADYLPYWWASGKTAIQAIQELSDAGLGVFFIAADGSAKYYSRHHISAPVISVTQADLKKDVSVNQPWDVVRNKVSIIAYPRLLESSTDLWQLRDKPLIPAGATVELWATFTYGGKNVPAINLIDPAATTDYLANTLENGTGTNLTGSFAISMYPFSEVAKLRITNNSVSDAYLILLKLRGQPISAPDPVTVISDDLASQALYGVRRFTLDSTWVQSTNTALDFVNFLKTYLSSPRAFPVIQIEKRPELQFAVDLFDRVDTELTALGIDGTYQIGQIQHDWLIDNGQAVNTVLKLEPFPDIGDEYWQFPTQLGVSSKFGF